MDCGFGQLQAPDKPKQRHGSPDRQCSGKVGAARMQSVERCAQEGPDKPRDRLLSLVCPLYPAMRVVSRGVGDDSADRRLEEPVSEHEDRYGKKQQPCRRDEGNARNAT